MPRWWNKTITVYHRILSTTNVQWQRVIYTNSFYGTEKRQVVSGLALTVLNKSICRIPGYGAVLAVGDIVVNGEISDILADNDSGNGLKKKYPGNCFVVGSVKYNTDIQSIAHVYGGECE